MAGANFFCSVVWAWCRRWVWRGSPGAGGRGLGRDSRVNGVACMGICVSGRSPDHFFGYCSSVGLCFLSQFGECVNFLMNEETRDFWMNQMEGAGGDGLRSERGAVYLNADLIRNARRTGIGR